MKNCFCLILLFPLIGSCKKEQPIHEAEKPFYFGVETENVTADGFQVSYRIRTEDVRETGVYYALDSMNLISGSGSNVDVVSIVRKSDEQIFILSDLLPYSTYWFKLFAIDANGVETFSPIYSIETGGFNIRWSENFPRISLKGSPVGGDVGLVGDLTDLDVSHYRATYDEIHCPILNIMPINDERTTHYVFISIPRSAPLGPHELSLYYLDRKIFEDELEILKGNFYMVTEHPVYGATGNYFLYDNEIYVYLFDTFYKWNPEENTWHPLPLPDKEIILGYGDTGHEINGKIYFPPYNTEKPAIDPDAVNYEEHIISYDPLQRKWEDHTLYTSKYVGRDLVAYCSFVYDNKLYSVVQKDLDRFNGGGFNLALTVYDPAVKSWEILPVELPFPDAVDCNSLVAGGKIYLLPSLIKDSFSATTTYENDLYEFDLKSNSFTRKTTWDETYEQRGTIDQYFFESDGHLFVFGGESSRGYRGVKASAAYEYDPALDSWSALSTHYISGHTAPPDGGFVFKVNNKIYIGMGEGIYGDEIYEFSLN